MAERKPDGLIVEVTLKGISPMLQDRMDEYTLVNVLLHGEKPNKDKSIPPNEIASSRAYREEGDTGPLGVPATNLFACLREAGRSVDYQGRKKVSTASSTRLPAILQIDGEFIPFEAAEGKAVEWKVDIRRGMMGQQKVAVSIVRPKFPIGWVLRPRIHIDFTTQAVSEGMVKKLFMVAGKEIGLCSFNPLHNGPFGRFKMTKWTIVEKVFDEKV